MSNQHPYPASEAIVPIGTGILLTLITCGLYGLYWRYKQMEVLNAWVGREDHNFLVYLLLTIITCSLYGMYYEYRMARSINEVQALAGQRVNDSLPMISVLFAIVGLALVSIAVQQSDINELYGENPDF
jgi:hypothetical protein